MWIEETHEKLLQLICVFVITNPIIRAYVLVSTFHIFSDFLRHYNQRCLGVVFSPEAQALPDA